VYEGRARGNQGEQFGVARLGPSVRFRREGVRMEGSREQGEQCGVARLGPSVGFTRRMWTKGKLAGTRITIWSSSVRSTSNVQCVRVDEGSAHGNQGKQCGVARVSPPVRLGSGRWAKAGLAGSRENNLE
jgi:hypothetical protein